MHGEPLPEARETEIGSPVTIYRSAEGERIVRDLYERAVRRLDLAPEDRYVETRFGETHVLVAGPAEAPPLVVLQGGNSLCPLTLAWYGPLAESFRLYAPDTVGQPGRSAPARPRRSEGGYGRWLLDVLDRLDLDRPRLVGTSHGGGVVLQAAAAEPRRIGPTALVMPAGVLRPRPLSMLRLALPMMLYRMRPGEERLRRAISPLFTEPPGDLWIAALGALFRHVKVETRLPRPMTAEELSRWRSPGIVFAAGDDPLYPGEDVLARAREIIPNLRDGVLLKGSRHIPAESTLRDVSGRIGSFLSSPSDSRA